MSSRGWGMVSTLRINWYNEASEIKAEQDMKLVTQNAKFVDTTQTNRTVDNVCQLCVRPNSRETADSCGKAEVTWIVMCQKLWVEGIQKN